MTNGPSQLKPSKPAPKPPVPESSIPVTTFVEPPLYGEIGAEVRPMEAEGKRGDGKQKTPLEYMIDVMNDPKATPDRRDRMAIQAAALMCKQAEQEIRVKRGRPKEKPLGKKAERQERANKAATEGIYAVPSGPRRSTADPCRPRWYTRPNGDNDGLESKTR